MNNHWFKSSLFEAEASEEEDTNPRCYGRQPATWLKDKLVAQGYTEAEVIPEDFAWVVLCISKPYRLWISVRNLVDYDNTSPDDPPPSKNELLWNCGVVLEQSMLGKLFGKGKNEAIEERDKLEQQLEQLLTNEPAIEIVDAP